MKRRMVFSFIFGVICVAIIAIGFVIYTQKQQELEPKRKDLERISQESYDSVFFSMYPLDGYSEEDFAFYRGTDTIISSYSIPELSVLSEYMDVAFATGNEITHVFLGIDPGRIWSSCGKNEDKWNRQIEEELASLLAANPQISFEIMFSYPDLDYWTSMTEEKMSIVLNTYRNIVEWLEGYDNVTMFYLGAEEWLIANPDSYVDEISLNAVVAQKIMLYTFCDRQFQITGENAEAFFEKLTALALQERANPAVYPDFSDWKLVFMGDSVIGNYYGSSSVPGVVTALCGADTYNYALGGSQATDTGGSEYAFPNRVNAFLDQKLELTQDNTVFPYEALTEDSQLCFLVHYGLNDYFNGCQVVNAEDSYDTETFAGALKMGVQRLQEAYPDAVIILITPPFTVFYSNGTERNGEKGGVLMDYVAAVEQVAREQNVLCMNNYVDLGITEETSYIYQEDGVHLNEYGRFVLGRNIVEVLEGVQDK